MASDRIDEQHRVRPYGAADPRDPRASRDDIRSIADEGGGEPGEESDLEELDDDFDGDEDEDEDLDEDEEEEE